MIVCNLFRVVGRAGRYGSKYPVGEVTCVDNEDLHVLHSAINAPSPILEHAGLFPHYDLILMCSHLHPKAGFKQILEQFLENAKLSPNYFIAESEDMLVLDLYVWLSYRMEDSFPDREVAISQKSLCSMLIEEFLLRYGGILQRPKATKLRSLKGLNKLF